jgi:hypothetical protein
MDDSSAAEQKQNPVYACQELQDKLQIEPQCLLKGVIGAKLHTHMMFFEI